MACGLGGGVTFGTLVTLRKGGQGVISCLVYCGMLSQFLILWKGWSETQSLLVKSCIDMHGSLCPRSSISWIFSYSIPTTGDFCSLNRGKTCEWQGIFQVIRAISRVHGLIIHTFNLWMFIDFWSLLGVRPDLESWRFFGCWKSQVFILAFLGVFFQKFKHKKPPHLHQTSSVCQIVLFQQPNSWETSFEKRAGFCCARHIMCGLHCQHGSLGEDTWHFRSQVEISGCLFSGVEVLEG